MAHMDGWFDAALDNASGLSTMLTLAEHFAQVPKEKRRRTMIFIGTAGHHVGSPNAIYLRDKRADLLAKTALMINCEHVAVSQTLNWDDQPSAFDSGVATALERERQRRSSPISCSPRTIRLVSASSATWIRLQPARWAPSSGSLRRFS